MFARKVGEEVGGVDKDALLRSVGLEGSGPVDPSHMIEDTDYYVFLERAAAADPRATTLPLRVGAAMRCDDYGAFGLAWKSAISLGGEPDIYLDGVRMAGGFGEALSLLRQIPASDVRDIQILRGPAAAFLHGSADGVIHVRTKSGRNE